MVLSSLRVVGWNANQRFAGPKAARLGALDPDVAVVAEVADDAEVPGMERVGWTGSLPKKGLAVFARPGLGAAVDPSFDPSLEWFLPVRLAALDVDVLGVWAMNRRGGPGQRSWRTRRALGYYAPVLARGRAVVIGDFNDNLRWDTPSYPAFAGTLEELGSKGYASVHHALTGERHGAESAVSLYWQRKRGQPYLVDHAFTPAEWLPRVRSFAIGDAEGWLDVSDHMPLVLDLGLPLPPSAGRAAAQARVPEPPRASWAYTERLLRALDAAARMHAAQRRKGSGVPYLAHPLAVASLVWEYGGDEEAVIAGLLHDALEDVPDTAAARAVVAGFGARVLATVEGCTDGVPGADGRKEPWRVRKERYLAHLAGADAAVLLVSAADKLHNTRSMLADLRAVGDGLWGRFNAPREDILWYHGALVEAMQANPAHEARIVAELARAVAELEGFGGGAAMRASARRGARVKERPEVNS